MNHLNKKSTDEATHQNMRKKDVYESDMYNTYNLILVKKNEQLQEKSASDANFQVVNTLPIHNRLNDENEEDIILK